jgi:protein TonB
VLKSDTSVRQGTYKLAVGRNVLEKGYYKMGLKDSLWLQYSLKGKKRSKGRYDNGKRSGTWEFFDYLGKLEQKIDFSKNQVLYYPTEMGNQIFRIISTTDTIMMLLDQPPLYVGGMSRFNDCVSKELNVDPLHKAGENVSGLVYVAITIDSMGKTSHHHILKGIGKSCNAEALRVIKAIPDEWLPGMLNGKRVAVDYVVPFRFNLNRDQTKQQHRNQTKQQIRDFYPVWNIDNEGYLNPLNIPRGLQDWGGNGENTQQPE